MYLLPCEEINYYKYKWTIPHLIPFPSSDHCFEFGI